MAITIFAGMLSIPLGRERAKAGTLPITAACPSYITSLRTARTYLERGDRIEAIAALRSAQEALATCIREDAGETAFAAVSHFMAHPG